MYESVLLEYICITVSLSIFGCYAPQARGFNPYMGNILTRCIRSSFKGGSKFYATSLIIDIVDFEFASIFNIYFHLIRIQQK